MFQKKQYVNIRAEKILSGILEISQKKQVPNLIGDNSSVTTCIGVSTQRKCSVTLLGRVVINPNLDPISIAISDLSSYSSSITANTYNPEPTIKRILIQDNFSAVDH